MELQRELPTTKEAYVRQLIHDNLDVLDGVFPGDENMFYAPGKSIMSPEEYPKLSYDSDSRFIK